MHIWTRSVDLIVCVSIETDTEPASGVTGRPSSRNYLGDETNTFARPSHRTAHRPITVSDDDDIHVAASAAGRHQVLNSSDEEDGENLPPPRQHGSVRPTTPAEMFAVCNAFFFQCF